MLVTCSNCGEKHTKNTLLLHKRRYWCQTYHLKNRPDFEHWLLKQDYDTLIWEYKQLFKEMVELNECVIDSDDDDAVREEKSRLAIKLLGPFKMY